MTSLRRIRWFVWAVLALAMLVSILANMLHAEPRWISRIIAMWPPVALLLTIELVTRVPLYRRGVAYVRRTATVSVALIAAWVSYWHMAGVAERYGETGLSVFVLPLSVDGLVVVASVCLVEVNGKLRDGVSVMAADREPVKTPEKLRTPAPVPRTRQQAIEPASKIGGVRNELDRPQTVAAAVRSAADRHGHDVQAVLEVVRTTHPEVSADTVRRTLARARTNGHSRGALTDA